MKSRKLYFNPIIFGLFFHSCVTDRSISRPNILYGKLHKYDETKVWIEGKEGPNIEIGFELGNEPNNDEIFEELVKIELDYHCEFGYFSKALSIKKKSEQSIVESTTLSLETFKFTGDIEASASSLVSQPTLKTETVRWKVKTFQCHPNPMDEAEKFTINCKNNPEDTESCFRHWDAILKYEKKVYKSNIIKPEVAKIFYDLCQNGHMHSCAIFLESQGEIAESVKKYKENCDENGYGASCFKFAFFLDNDEGETLDTGEYYMRACRKKSDLSTTDGEFACERAEYILTD